jgi:isoquinoline 1-oxidoreductase beta subunit
MSERGRISRRTLLTAGGAGIGLVLAWTFWPRRYPPNLRAGPGEHVLNAFLKIAEDGRIAVAVGQAETGQGVYTALPQILADELGADWRTIGVEPAPIHPLFANRLLAGEAAEEALPRFLAGTGGWAAREIATRSELMITAGSTSIRAFEAPFRAAGATARALLCMTAAERWGVSWEACDTSAGFVVRGDDRLRFAELAARAAELTPPDAPPLRRLGQGGLSGHSAQRLDVPAKVDGTARYAGDVRLPGMVFASVCQGPVERSRLQAVDKQAARRVPGVLAVVENPGWAAAVASNWWAADRAVAALRPQYRTAGSLPDDASISHALAEALNSGPSQRVVERGDADAVLAGKGMVTADYAVAMAPHAAIEPLVATARAENDAVEVWAPTQAPEALRTAVARATGLWESQVTVYQTLHGGSFGRKLESDAAVQAAVLARQVGRPVQLCWSRSEEMLHDRPRPPARAHLRGRVADGAIAAWAARIAVPATSSDLARRLGWSLPSLATGEPAAVDGALPSYAIPAVAIDHAPAEIGIATGLLRGAAHGYCAFFTECFVDELAASAGIDALTFRIAMLGDRPRLARVLSTAAARGGWDGGGPGSGQGLAAHSAYGSHIAMLVQAHFDDDQQIAVDRVVTAVDCGRMINPDIVRQQIEGGIIFALGVATGGALTLSKGVVEQRNLDALRLPGLAHCPEIVVELINSRDAPGGVSELAVPPFAPALANALFSATGQRMRHLPMRGGA